MHICILIIIIAVMIVVDNIMKFPHTHGVCFCIADGFAIVAVRVVQRVVLLLRAKEEGEKINPAVVAFH